MTCSDCPHDCYIECSEFHGYCLNLLRFVVASSSCETEEEAG
jgi:hypothetical protein